jgi:hypothetical protein
MCLDVLRAFAKSADTRGAVLHELAQARGRHRNFDAALGRFTAMLDASAPAEAQARRFAQLFVTLIQAGVLLRAANDASARAVAEGFCATRLDPDSGWGAVFGAGGAALDTTAILNRAWHE